MATSEKPRLQLPGTAVTIQRLAVYETKSAFYLVGNNNESTSFRYIRIDRTDPKEISIADDRRRYTKSEMQTVIHNIEEKLRSNKASKGSTGSSLKKLLMSFGLLGFVKFTQGYYLVFITRRRKIAQIGAHIIYKVEDITLTDLATEKSNTNSTEENRYLKYFNSLDFSSNFYFCYTMDITRTIQQNIVPVPQGCTLCVDGSCDKCLLGTRAHFTSNEKFMWNVHMLQAGGFIDKVAPEWIIPLVYGFVSQANISVFGKSIYLTLIARRSSKYAGTRFLKRGMNEDGDVANEVETEQVVHDASYNNHRYLKITAYVQLRGSVPAFWHQDTSTMVPKPPITISKVDPYFSTAAKHFNYLLSHYGAPIYLLNLVKNKEKRNHEILLTNELVKTITYLNQFLPTVHQIQYCGFDMSKYSKTKGKRHNVMEKLEEIAVNTFQLTGFFHNTAVSTYPDAIKTKLAKVGYDTYGKTVQGRYQTGTVRTNCVDCLDRTNTAQFVLGKVALEYQLLALGVINSPGLCDNTPCIHSLEEIYEDHGDTMALQYGGSQLVHRIRGYRKDNQWTSHSVDILNTVSRYYRNAFTDYEKQNAINLFLGKFEVCEMQMSLWDMTSDYYLHHQPKLYHDSYTQWWSEAVRDALPLPSTIVHWHQLLKTLDSNHLKTINDPFFNELYRPTMLTSFEEHFCVFMPSTKKEAGLLSPFSQNKAKVISRTLSVRTKPVSVYPVNNKQNNTDSDTDTEDDFSDEEESMDITSERSPELEAQISPCPTASIQLKHPSPRDSSIYSKYANDSHYLFHDEGRFSLSPPTTTRFHALQSKLAQVPPAFTSAYSKFLYGRTEKDIEVMFDAVDTYKKYCNYNTESLLSKYPPPKNRIVRLSGLNNL